MAEADSFILSTPYLARQAGLHFDKKAFVNKNAVSQHAIDLSSPFFKAKQAKPTPILFEPITIVYASGWARAHQEDFGVAVEALRQVLCDRPQAHLKIVGHLELEGQFKGYEERITFQEFVAWENLFETLSQTDINLAPIVANPQRCSKSAVKFLESALVGVPTVASNLEPYQDIIHGETGFLAGSTEEWYRCLLSLIDSPDLRRKMGQAAREQILAQDTVALRAPHLKQIITEIIEDFYGNA
jgi:glycosyltransferase involved in cell wall biosynthesis